MIDLFFAVAVFFVFVLAIVPTWSMITTGQRLYLLLFGAILGASVVIGPYRNPIDDTIVWGVSWNPPTYVDPNEERVLTPERVEKINRELEEVMGAKIAVKPNQIRRKTMWRYGGRRNTSILVFAGLLGWFVIPPCLNRLLTKSWD